MLDSLSPRRPQRLLWLGLLGLLVLSAGADAANHTIQLGGALGNSFSPANLTLEVGDSVTWTNLGGFHNVESDSFRCANGCDDTGGDGSASSNLWSVTRTFNTVGTINYVCIVHAGLGMTGQLVVQPMGGGGMAGELRFSVASIQVNEGGGNATVSVSRIGGDDGAVSVDYATANGSANAGSDYVATSGTLTWPDGNDDIRSFTVAILDDGDDEPNETVNLMLSNPGGGATLGSPSTATLTVVDNDQAAPDAGALGFASSAFQASEAAGQTTITVTRSGGTDGAVSVDWATSDGSASAGNDYAAGSGTLAWANGDGSSKSFTVQLFDDAESEGAETIHLMLSGPTGGAALGTSSATLTLTDDETGGGCVADATTFCLNKDGRFRVQVEFADFAGNRDFAKAFDIGKRDSGLFYFFNEDNIEVLIKVLDACNAPDFETYWVFYAATTNLELTVTVTDTVTATTKVYTNELGQAAAPVVDTAAFATCP